jgi:hypothetical protein
LGKFLFDISLIDIFNIKREVCRDNKIRARVFITSGQNKDKGEREIAGQILTKLDLDFDPYVAIEEQTLKSIKENIFPKLEESEYFIFVDFKREIRKDDRILGTIQASSIPFTDRDFLASVIAEKIRELGWNPYWRNELTMDRNEQEYTDAIFINTNQGHRWYHIEVKNLHHKKISLDCIAYLENIENVSTGKKKTFPPVEFKWQALNVPRIIIPPGYTRPLDAFFVPHISPNLAYFGINGSLVDFGGLFEVYNLEGPGSFELNFIVFSVNFSPIRQTFLLDIGNSLEDIKFRMKNKENYSGTES